MIWRDIPSLTALRAFAAYAERGTLSSAGDAVGVSHAAISQQIHALEAELRLPLVTRSPRGLTLTAEGRVLAEALAEGFGSIAQGVATLREGGQRAAARGDET